jgi:hypothetical protein
VSCSTRFDSPIALPDGGKLVTLKDAISWLAKEVTKSEHDVKQVQAAAHCVTDAADPMMSARMGMMQALNRHHVREFNPKEKEPHWGRRRLARDR